MTDDEISSAERLVARLNAHWVIPEHELSARRAKSLGVFFDSLEGANAPRSWPADEIYSLGQGDFFRTIRENSQSLAWNVSVLERLFTRYWETGETPAPHFALRVAILCRKRNRPDLERDFLEAWARHIGSPGPGHGKYSTLEDRLNVYLSGKWKT